MQIALWCEKYELRTEVTFDHSPHVLDPNERVFFNHVTNATTLHVPLQRRRLGKQQNAAIQTCWQHHPVLVFASACTCTGKGAMLFVRVRLGLSFAGMKSLLRCLVSFIFAQVILF
mmetsp:Transcript_70618/g.117266  ORF Transcript_70618/g.117266 Transcript_70618/m.117266 type:complete len:116 (-) Transcript_70618:164-511(-)